MPSPDEMTALRRLRSKREHGLALITAVLVLMLVAATALTAIGISEEELVAGGRSRSTMNSLYAAESGLEVASKRLQAPRNLNAFSITTGDGSTVESRKRSEASPQDLIEGGLGAPPTGYSINLGTGYINETFEVNVTAEKTGAPTSELEVRLGILSANGASY